MTPLETLAALADALIGEPGKLTITERKQNGTTVLSADVEQQFYGRIIGRQGSIIESLRVILAMCGRKAGKPIALQVPEKERRETDSMPFVPNLTWKTEWLLTIAQQTAAAMFTKPAAVDATDTEDGRTRLRFTLSNTEPKPLPDSAIETALLNVFRAIGNANGRKVKVELRRA